MWTFRKVPGAAPGATFGRTIAPLLASFLFAGSILLSPQVRALDTNCFPCTGQKTTSIRHCLWAETCMKSFALKKWIRSTPSQLPVWISGFQRGWMTRIKNEGKYTTLGVTPETGKLLNGILVEATPGYDQHPRPNRAADVPNPAESENHQFNDRADEYRARESSGFIHNTGRFSSLQPAGQVSHSDVGSR